MLIRTRSRELNDINCIDMNYITTHSCRNDLLRTTFDEFIVRSSIEIDDKRYISYNAYLLTNEIRFEQYMFPENFQFEKNLKYDSIQNIIF